uniref:Kinesin motor domain-containing protein n=1 Tax=Periophthalmus magnuspinnatus TaxID=409849 RepID=A0A3B3ZQP1_9GOBI
MSLFCIFQNSVVEEKEHLQVYLRIRPFTAAESYTGEAQVRQVLGSHCSASQVYGPDTTQKQLYDGTVKDLVKDVLTGGNSLVFTYGVTNAGKTFTFLGPEADAGLLPRALSTIFNSIEEHVYSDISIRPHRCREFTRLTKEQQVEQILLKRSLFKQSSWYCRKVLIRIFKSLSNDRISLDLGEHTKFSVWVSFCEIYNENIHDLLEALPSSTQKRTALRLSQDVKGHSFVKDLRWVHVDTAEEAYRVLKLGKKNQSFSSTKLNQLSSRSHSIFSIRILKIEDVGTPRVSAISELCLCDLAGSERCAKTQNKGERLKEAGNINSSLHILGKCINALRHNQQAKLLQHVPFRESKLTHYLQSFLCGRGRACMIVNINQCASMYDETLNVLKFSAVAQKVVVLNSKNQQLLPERSSTEASFLLDSEEQPKRRRRSSVSVWDTSLEDVQVSNALHYYEHVLLFLFVLTLVYCLFQNQMALLGHLQVQLKQELAESLAMEARIRDEISKEFSQIFSEMQKDYDDRLAREREILEERAEKRLEIFKDLSQKMSRESHYQDRSAMVTRSFVRLCVCVCVCVCVCGGAWRNDNTDKVHKEKLAESVRRRESMQKKLEEREKEVAALQRSLDQREQAESQAVQETRRKEVERRRELLAKAEEAIAQKDAELEKKSMEITRLKQSSQQDVDRVQSLSTELRRREEHGNELQEKLADYKKQIQQVQKEISSMREEERGLKQRLSDLEKSKKQLQTDLANRDRTILNLKMVTKNQIIENMRLALSEQEETQEQMEHVMEEKDHRVCLEKHRTERKAWMEEKLSLIGQAKDAEDRRNQDMRRFAEDREKYQRQQSQVESLSSQLSQKEQTMEQWRKDRDTLVSALEVQLQKLLSSQAQKDKLIQELQQSTPQAPPEVSRTQRNNTLLQAALSEREAEIHRLKEELQAAQTQGDNKQVNIIFIFFKPLPLSASLCPTLLQSSASCPSVLDSSEISTDNGRTSRFPKPELEISFSPLQPNRMALRRQGEESAVTVKITRSARKRKSNEMDKEEVEAENRRNTRTKVTPKLTPHQEEVSSSLRSRKEGTLQKIGDFLQSSPTLLGSKGLGRDMDPSGSSPSLRGKKKKRNLYRPEISSPMDMPPHPVSDTHHHPHDTHSH